jgi:serine protease Do
MKLPRALRVVLCLGFTAAVLRGAAAEPAPVTPTQDPVLAAVFPAIVRIEAIRLRPNDGRLTKQWSAGSGVVISPTGHVLTNCHVTDDGDYFRCYLFDGSHVDARCIGQDALTDLAVLQLDLTQRPAGAPPLVVAPFGDSAALHAGDPVYALGSPGFLAQSVTRGIVSNPSLVLPEQTAGRMVLRGENVGTLVRWILHDARIFGGNSGGPLVNTRGEIVGINELGVFNLSGAIPGNLARGVATQLVEHGRVIRGWSGITVQPRLEADGVPRGVVVADLAQSSPAASADLRPGDVILACDGDPIDDAEEKAVAHFNRLETARPPGSVFTLDLLRSGQKRTVQLTLATREPAETDAVELRGWGAVVRDLSRALVREEQLPDATGVWVDNVQPAGPAGQAEPMLRRGDVIVAVDGTPVRDVAGLRAVTTAKIGNAPAKPHPVLASFRRDGALLQAVVELRELRDHNVTQQARKAWLGAESQPLTQKLRARLGIAASGGARLTRIYADTEAAKAGLQVGDVITAIDGIAVEARRAEDSDVLARQVRQYRAGTAAAFTLWRAGATLELPVTLETQPTPAAEMPWWEDPDLEFSAHDLAFDDRVRLQLPAGLRGVLVESAVPAGWAALAGLRGDDVIIAAAGVPVAAVGELDAARQKAAKEHVGWWVLLVHRRGQTLLVEISLKPAKAKS